MILDYNKGYKAILFSRFVMKGGYWDDYCRY